MRTYRAAFSIGIVGVGIAALGFGLSPASSFDGTRTPESATVAVPMTPGPGGDTGSGTNIGRATPLAAVPIAPLPTTPRPTTPFEAFRSGTQALRAGNTAQAVNELEYAADQGVPAAQWKLGRMYADGDGVQKNTARAFEYFSRLTRAHGDDAPGTPQARLVANAFVSLGQMYLEGVPDSSVAADPTRAREMYWYAASYFADPDAQYNLGRLYLDRNSNARDPRQAAKWLGLAAKKGQYQAQALLGSLLVKGDGVPRQAALGLFWLTLAKDGAGPDETWITETYSNAFAQATDTERTVAYKYLENWLGRGLE
jgi:TPR repeat protein